MCPPLCTRPTEYDAIKAPIYAPHMTPSGHAQAGCAQRTHVANDLNHATNFDSLIVSPNVEVKDKGAGNAYQHGLGVYVAQQFTKI